MSFAENLFTVVHNTAIAVGYCTLAYLAFDTVRNAVIRYYPRKQKPQQPAKPNYNRVVDRLLFPDDDIISELDPHEQAISS